MRRVHPEIMKDTARYDAKSVWQFLLKRDFLKDHVVKYYYRPLDIGWVYWEPETKLLGEKSPAYWPHVLAGNLWIEAREKQAIEVYSRGIVTACLADNIGNGFSSFFPMRLSENGGSMASVQSHRSKANLTRSSARYLNERQLPDHDFFYHVVAVVHAPLYRSENSSALRMGWPRTPVPTRGEVLRASSLLGSALGRLLDPEEQIWGVTRGDLRAEARTVAVPTNKAGGALDDMTVSVGWGYGTGAVMPGPGRITERAYRGNEREAMAEGAEALGVEPDELFRLLGETTCDVRLNETAYWANVPKNVWRYKLGGYQVIKKWLSYREKDVLGRALRFDEVLYVTEMARRIAAILLMGPELDANYRAVVADAIGWQAQFSK
jgi:Type ISP C-terminal specificity domain